MVFKCTFPIWFIVFVLDEHELIVHVIQGLSLSIANLLILRWKPGGSSLTSLSSIFKFIKLWILFYWSIKRETCSMLQISLIKLQSDFKCDSWEPPSIWTLKFTILGSMNSVVNLLQLVGGVRRFINLMENR